MSVDTLRSEKDLNYRRVAAVMQSCIPNFCSLKQCIGGIRIKSSRVWLLASYYIVILQNIEMGIPAGHVRVWLREDEKAFDGLVMVRNSFTARL